MLITTFVNVFTMNSTSLAVMSRIAVAAVSAASNNCPSVGLGGTVITNKLFKNATNSGSLITLFTAWPEVCVLENAIIAASGRGNKDAGVSSVAKAPKTIARSAFITEILALAAAPVLERSSSKSSAIPTNPKCVRMSVVSADVTKKPSVFNPLALKVSVL